MGSGEQWPSDGHQRRMLDCLSKEPSVAATPIVLTVPQVASALEVSRSTIYRIIAEGMLESVQVRGMTRIRPAAIERYLDALERSNRETVAGFHV